MEPFGCHVNEALKVLYIDFELSPAQFEARYTDNTYGLRHFGENFVRAEFNPAGDDPQLYDKYDDYALLFQKGIRRRVVCDRPCGDGKKYRESLTSDL